MNETILQFNYPDSVIHEYNSWIVLMRPQQVTLGSLVLACKGEYESLADVPADVYAELSIVTSHIEKTLAKLFKYDRINYLLLMMRDKYVHFHVIPRYASTRDVLGMTFADKTWPMPPDITKPLDISKDSIESLTTLIKNEWVNE